MISYILVFILGDPDSVSGEFGQQSLYKMLGYFSLIGLLRLHSLLGDYYQALKVLESIDFNKKVCLTEYCYLAHTYTVCTTLKVVLSGVNLNWKLSLKVEKVQHVSCDIKNVRPLFWITFTTKNHRKKELCSHFEWSNENLNICQTERFVWKKLRQGISVLMSTKFTSD